MNYQGNLALGAGDFVALTHRAKNGYYPHKVYTAENDSFSGWHEIGLTLQDAIVNANRKQALMIQDCYVSGSGFRFDGNRSQANVSSLNSFWVDLDYQKTKYKNLAPIEFAETVLRENEWLPKPSILISSGTGIWFLWKLKQSLLVNNLKGVDWLSQWQTYQDFLTEQLKPYGADSSSNESARVMRLPETINSKNGALAQAWDSGNSYAIADLKKQINEHYRKVKKPNTGKNVYLLPERNLITPVQARKEGYEAFSWHSLARARVNDMERLAWLRGGKLDDNRRMAAFAYAVEAAHFCRTEQSLRQEVTSFVERFFRHPDRYLKSLNYDDVIRRMVAHVERGFELSDKRADNPYQLTRNRLIEYLQVTDSEARTLKAIITDNEKYRRKVDKRRKDGIKSRDDYLSEANNRKEQARKLKEQGYKVTEIAKELGVKRNAVYVYLRD